MSRSHAEAHRRIKLIAAEIDRLLTRLRSIGDEPRQLAAEVASVARGARGTTELAEWGAFLDAHAALIARGGALALLQGAVGLASASLVTLAAEEWALGRSWKVNWFRRTQRPRDWSPAGLVRTIDLDGYRAGAWAVLDGARLLGPGPGGAGLRLVSVVEGQVLAEAPAERRTVEALAMLPDGHALVGHDDGSVQRWSVGAQIESVARHTCHQGAVTALAVSGEGHLAVTLGADGVLQVWGLATAAAPGNPLRKLAAIEVAGRPARVVTLSPSGGYVIAGFADGRIEMWPTGDRGRHKVLRGHGSPVERLVARKGLLVSSDNRGEVRRWAMPTGEPLPALPGHRAPVGFLWLDEAGERLVSGASDGTLRVTSLVPGGSLDAAPATPGAVIALGPVPALDGPAAGDAVAAPDGGATAPDGVTAPDGSAGASDVTPAPGATLPAPGELPSRLFAGVGEGATAACALPDGRLAIGGSDGSVRVLDVASGEATIVGHHEGPVARLAAVDDNAVLSCGLLDRTARVWLRAAPVPAPRAVLGLDPEGQRALCAVGPELEVFDFAESRRLQRLPADASSRWLPLLDHGRLLVDRRSPPLPLFAGHLPVPHAVQLVDVERGLPVRTLEGHRLPVRVAVVDGPGRLLATGASDGEVKLWDFQAETAAPLLTLRAGGSPALGLAFEPGGVDLHVLYAGGEVCSWSTRSGKLLRRVALQHAPEAGLTMLRALGERELLLAGPGGDVGRWEADGGRRIRAWRSHPGEILALDVEADGELLATGGDDRRLRLWRRGNGKLQAVYDLPSPVVGCRFLPDGRLAAWGALGEPHLLKFVDWAQED